MYVLLVKLQSIQNEDNNKIQKLGRFRRSDLRHSVRFREGEEGFRFRFPDVLISVAQVERKDLLTIVHLVGEN